MTNHFTRHQEAPKEVGALLWLADIDAKHPAAPEWLGGQRFNEQERIVKAQAERDGFILTDADLIVVDMPDEISSALRLGDLVEFVRRRPIRRLYMPGSVFADLSAADVRTYTATLRDLNTDLILCTD